MTRTLRMLAAVVAALALISGAAIRDQALAEKEKKPAKSETTAPSQPAGGKPEAASRSPASQSARSVATSS